MDVVSTPRSPSLVHGGMRLGAGREIDPTGRGGPYENARRPEPCGGNEAHLAATHGSAKVGAPRMADGAQPRPACGRRRSRSWTANYKLMSGKPAPWWGWGEGQGANSPSTDCRPRERVANAGTRQGIVVLTKGRSTIPALLIDPAVWVPGVRRDDGSVFPHPRCFLKNLRGAVPGRVLPALRIVHRHALPRLMKACSAS